MEALAPKHGKRAIPLAKSGLGRKSQTKSRTSELDPEIIIGCGDHYLAHFEGKMEV